jgi:hypothetical protein
MSSTHNAPSTHSTPYMTAKDFAEYTYFIITKAAAVSTTTTRKFSTL